MNKFVFIIHDLPLAVQSQKHLILKLQPQHNKDMLSASLGFLKDKRATDYYSILACKK